MHTSSRWFTRRAFGLLCIASGLGSQLVAQTPARIASRIQSVGLFKNGIAVVRREVQLPGAGVYQIDDVPEPVHGTFWIEASAKVDTRVTSREVTRPLDGSAAARLELDLAGQAVRITFRDPRMAPLEGVVIDSGSGQRSFSRDFEAPDPRTWWLHPTSQSADEPPARFLVIQAGDGLTYVDSSTIALMTVAASTTVKRRVPVLELSVAGPIASGGAVATISYLAKGIAWTPAYHLELRAGGHQLTIRQQAVVRNELENLAGVEVLLITGFPSIEFAHVLSPLAFSTSWASFFTQLNRRVGAPNDVTGNVVSQQAVSYSRAAEGDPTALAQVGDGVDVHYHSVGQRSLALGESLMTEVAVATTSYESLVEWVVPDTRDADGRLIDDWRRLQQPDAFDDSPWDAVRFENPFDFPLTTAPAVMSIDGRFGGQRTLRWVTPGEASTVRVNKALSIRTHASEVEQPDEREVINYGGRNYRRVLVKGELLACNHRKESVALQVRRQFSGELASADGEPQKSLREEGVYSVNPRYELSWKLELKPGEQRTLNYTYDVLVAH
ncbi:MAG: hypothetical protein U1E76_00575 [Planctomycetota bacterium]